MIVLLFHLFNELPCWKKVLKILKLKLSNWQTSGTPASTHTYLPAILDFNQEEEPAHEEDTRNEHDDTCSDSDSGDVMSPLLENVATY